MAQISKRKKLPQQPQPAAPTLSEERVSGFLERHSVILTIALVLIASIRIVTTYTVFSHTSDEPAHVACGMEWLDKGMYTWEPQHPPLARVAIALGPYLTGIRSQGTPHPKSLDLYQDDNLNIFREGAKIFYYGKHYDRTLALARLGVLPFFWVACLAVYWWGRRSFSAAVAVVAVFLFTFIPPVLAHSSVATTDMALTAFMTAAFLTGLIWVEQPTVGHSIWFGLASGLMVLSKFSCLAFFPVIVALALAGYLVAQRPGLSAVWRAGKARIPTFGLALMVGFVAIWAGYRFSFGKVPFTTIPLPFPELFNGIQQVRQHAAHGHSCYLLGEIRETGFWNFYLVGIAFKSPLGFLGLLGIGLILLLWKHPLTRRLWLPLVFSGGTLLVGIFSTINIGLRHVLPVYVGFSLLAAVAVVRLLELGRTRKWTWGLLGALVLWMTASSALSHPDYLAYFNELAGSEPENILVDSDLDWGQDIKRLATRLHEVGATSVAWTGYVWAELEKEHDFPRIRPMNRFQPEPGWSAIGVTLLKGHRTIFWADQIPPHWRVGKSIYLWYFPPAGGGVTPAPR
jgi:4-amino-4-deoxy-L-arabinose transferase-like glycosyltransferase